MPAATGTSTTSATSKVMSAAIQVRPDGHRVRRRICIGSIATAITTAQASEGRKVQAIHSPSSASRPARVSRAMWVARGADGSG